MRKGFEQMDGVFHSPDTDQMLHFKCLIFNDVAVGFEMLHSMLHFKYLIMNDVAVVALYRRYILGYTNGMDGKSGKNVSGWKWWPFIRFPHTVWPENRLKQGP
jgi:hypothetical protein